MTVFGMVINFCRHWRLYLCWACWVHSFYQVSNRVFLVFCFTLKIQRIKWLHSIKTQYAIREVRGEYYLAELFVVFTLGESLIKKGVKLKKNGKMRNSAKNTKIRITKKRDTVAWRWDSWIFCIFIRMRVWFLFIWFWHELESLKLAFFGDLHRTITSYSLFLFNLTFR